MPTHHDTENVEFRLIPDWPGYRVGSDGSVWSCKNGSSGLRSTWRLLRPLLHVGGYLRVSLSRRFPAKVYTVPVHTLVLEAFIGPRSENHVCCHGNGNPVDNRLANLRWDTEKANAEDAIRHGTHHVLPIRAKLTPEQAAAIRKVYMAAPRGAHGVEGSATAAIAQQFGVNTRTVLRIARGR